MHPRRTGGTCHIHPVIHQNRRAIPHARHYTLHQSSQFPAGQILFSNLDPIHTRLRGLLYFLKLKIYGAAG
jgi:hypothetical protein